MISSGVVPVGGARSSLPKPEEPWAAAARGVARTIVRRTSRLLVKSFMVVRLRCGLDGLVLDGGSVRAVPTLPGIYHLILKTNGLQFGIYRFGIYQCGLVSAGRRPCPTWFTSYFDPT